MGSSDQLEKLKTQLQSTQERLQAHRATIRPLNRLMAKRWKQTEWRLVHHLEMLEEAIAEMTVEMR